MQSARIWRHSKAERRSNRSAEPGTMTEGPNGTPQGASRKGPNRLLATHYAESLATSHLAQPAEPPYADPHVRWCGRGGRATVPPIPIACAGEAKKKTAGRKLPAVSWGNTTTKTTGLFLQSANESYHVANLLFGEFAIKRR